MLIQDLHLLFLESSGVSTDTRKITPNCIFFALKGKNFNGNKFADEALSKGAIYTVVDEEEYATNDNTILVSNVLETLQKLATNHRTKLNTPIVALTGSNGKTTTKELINAVLSTKYNTIATIGNLNNHIGVPLTLLRLSPKTEIAIIEMGANHQKEIEFLCTIAQPDYGLITNFGKAHLEGFGGIEGVIKGKSELYNYLIEHNKLVFVNNDAKKQLNQLDAYTRIFKYGGSLNLDLTINQIESESGFVSVSFDNIKIQSNLIGSYNFNNIAYAISIGKHFGVSNADIKSAIESYIPDNNRSQILNIKGNSIILDAYNANPSSMMAALKNFKTKSQKKSVLILGDMFELGEFSKEEHQAIVDYVERNLSSLNYFVGYNFYNTITNSKNSIRFNDFKDLVNHISKNTIVDSNLLIKGSRGMALERILEHL